jgi:hypothetical membrane protein
VFQIRRSIGNEDIIDEGYIQDVNTKIVRLMGFFGVAAPIVGGIMISLSILSTPGWSLSEDTLSALGAEGFGAILFNGGLPMTGAVMMLFSTGLFELSRKAPIGQTGSAMYLAVSVITVALGLVTINYRPYHNYLATVFFTLIPLSMIVFSVHLMNIGLRTHAVIGFICGATAAGAALLGIASAYHELASALSLAIWQIALGLWMFKQSEPGE